MRISDWSSDVCSSDLDILIAVACAGVALQRCGGKARAQQRRVLAFLQLLVIGMAGEAGALGEQIVQRDARFGAPRQPQRRVPRGDRTDRKSTRLNSSH